MITEDQGDVLDFLAAPSTHGTETVERIDTHSAIVFLAAGLYQFAPLKRACLTHCRSPIGFFLTRWRNGPAAGFRIGLEHGIHCLGCCWALMATALAVGVMNLWWMAALAAIALVEQVAPHGDTFRRPLGVALIAAGVWRYTT